MYLDTVFCYLLVCCTVTVPLQPFFFFFFKLRAIFFARPRAFFCCFLRAQLSSSSMGTPADRLAANRQSQSTKKYVIDSDELERREQIGKGAYGLVWRAIWRGNTTENYYQCTIRTKKKKKFFRSNQRTEKKNSFSCRYGSGSQRCAWSRRTGWFAARGVGNASIAAAQKRRCFLRLEKPKKQKFNFFFFIHRNLYARSRTFFVDYRIMRKRLIKRFAVNEKRNTKKKIDFFLVMAKKKNELNFQFNNCKI